MNPESFWFKSAEGRPLARLCFIASPVGFKQICLFVEVRLAVGFPACKAAAFNWPLLWRVGEHGGIRWD